MRIVHTEEPAESYLYRDDEGRPHPVDMSGHTRMMGECVLDDGRLISTVTIIDNRALARDGVREKVWELIDARVAVDVRAARA